MQLTYAGISALESLKKFLESRLFFKLCFFSSLIIICFVFIGPHARAAESGNGLIKDLASSLRVEVTKETGQTKDISSIDPEKIFSEVLDSTPHVRVSLSEKLKLFFNLRPAMKDYYDRRDNKSKKCTMLGLDILF